MKTQAAHVTSAISDFITISTRWAEIYYSNNKDNKTTLFFVLGAMLPRSAYIHTGARDCCVLCDVFSFAESTLLRALQAQRSQQLINFSCCLLCELSFFAVCARAGDMAHFILCKSIAHRNTFNLFRRSHVIVNRFHWKTEGRFFLYYVSSVRQTTQIQSAA